MANWKPATLTSIVLMFGCADSAIKPSEIVNDPVVQSALSDILSRSDPNPTVGSSDCTANAMNFSRPGNIAYWDDIVYDEGANTVPRLEGTWHLTECGYTDATTFPALTIGCDGTISWHEQQVGMISQENTSAVSSGQGEVTLVVTDGQGGAFLIQTNHAVGQGCEQDLVNLIRVRATTSASIPFTFSNINVLKSSTCGGALWKCAYSFMSM